MTGHVGEGKKGEKGGTPKQKDYENDEQFSTTTLVFFGILIINVECFLFSIFRQINRHTQLFVLKKERTCTSMLPYKNRGKYINRTFAYDFRGDNVCVTVRSVFSFVQLYRRKGV